MKRLVALMMLAGCAGTAPRPMPLAESGPVDVVLGGRAFVADLQPGPVLTVTRETAFGDDEGKLATDVARQFCAGRGRDLSRRAYGRFSGGAWVFEGGCA